METMYRELQKHVDEQSLKQMTLQLMDARNRNQINTFRPLLHRLCTPPINAFPDTNTEKLNDRQLFLHLLRFFHPDRHAALTAMLEAARSRNDLALLRSLQEVFRLNRPASRITVADRKVRVDETYAYEEGDFDDSFHYRDADYEEAWIRDEDAEYDFYAAVAAACIGNVEISLDASDLTHLAGELLLRGYGLEDLDGLAWCESIEVLDLSYNRIANLYDLKDLIRLEELNLSHNRIDSIDHLKGLTHLKVLNLADNDIDDISVLTTLEELEYVDISNNPCIADRAVINQLTTKEVIVITFGE